MKHRKLYIRIPIIIIGIILLVILFTQTGIFKNILRNVIVDKTNKILVDSEFSIGKIEGNLFKRIRIKNIMIQTTTDTLLYIREFFLEYRLWPLITHKVIVEKMIFDKVKLNLEQYKDGNWNLTRILPEPESESDSETSSEVDISWDLVLNEFRVRDTSILLQFPEPSQYIPRRITDIDLLFEASYLNGIAHFDLSEFNLLTEDPEAEIKNCSVAGEMNLNYLQIEPLELTTAMNYIVLSVIYDLNYSKIEHMTLQALDLILEEFRSFLPELPLTEFPEVNLYAVLNKDHFESDLRLIKEEQSITVTAKADGIYDVPEYLIDLSTEKLNFNDWMDDPALSSDLNLDLQIAGSGIDPVSSEVQIRLDSQNSSFMDQTIQTMVLEAEKDSTSASFKLDLMSDSGIIDMKGQMSNIFDLPEFNVFCDLKKIDLSTYTGTKEMKSDINVSFQIVGQGNDPTNLVSDLNLNFLPSHIAGIDLKYLDSEISYDKGIYQINKFEAENTLLYLDISGSGNINSNHNIHYTVESRDLSKLNKFMDIDDIRMKANLSGSINGTANDLNSQNNISISDFNFNTLSADAMTANILLNKIDNLFEAESEISILELKNGNLVIDKIDINSHGNMNKIETTIDLAADSLKFYNLNRIIIDSVITVELPEIQFNYGDHSFQTVNETGKIILNENRFIVEEIELKDQNSTIQIEGYIEPGVEQDLSIKLAHIDISQLNQFNVIPYKIMGIMDFDANLNGSMAEPLISAELVVSQPGINDLYLRSITANFQLQDRIFSSDLQIFRNENELISVNAVFPVNLDTSESSEFVPKNESIQVDMNIKDFELSTVDEFTKQIEDLDGIFNLDLKLRNTINEPVFNGSISLEEGQLRYPLYGLEYSELGLNSTFNNDSLYINDLFIKGGVGYLSIKGKLDLSRIKNKEISDFEFTIDADEFTAANRTDLNLLTNMSVSIKGTPSGSTFGGNIEITRSRIDLDKLQTSKSPSRDLNEPLLIQSLTKHSEVDSIVEKTQIKGAPDFLNNLTGKLRVLIPKNTWIKNKDMNLEISGDLEVLKTGNYFEIFGSISTIRGKYDLYGRKFELEEGLISFNGGSQMNPHLDIIIKHIFRDANRTKREMRISLTGYSLDPEILFILDEDPITEADAVSYLLFGKSNEEISQSEKSQVSGYGQSDFARSLLAKEIGSRIGDQLAKTLNLNVIEFSGGENMKKGSILIGKYITNDLYVSYQKEFSIDQSKEIVPDKVSLEYEISKYFSLQATRGDEKSTGFDLYWKFKRK